MKVEMKVGYIIPIVFLVGCSYFGIVAIISSPEYLRAEEYQLPRIESENIYTLYRHYKEIPRFPTEDYACYVFDEGDDKYLLHRFRDADVEYIDRFIQNNITYKKEEGEYPKFPIETLFEGTGDCEDLAILGASILSLNGYNVSLVKDGGHMVLLVDGRYVLGKVEPTTEYPITPRPVVFHYWGEVEKKTTTLTTTFEGVVYVENRGNRVGNITLSISGVTESVEIEPFSKTNFKFKINEESLRTKLYLDGVLIDENKPVND